MTEHVKTEVDAGIMTLTLARPDKMNALSNAMYSAMSDALEGAESFWAVQKSTAKNAASTARKRRKVIFFPRRWGTARRCAVRNALLFFPAPPVELHSSPCDFAPAG